MSFSHEMTPRVDRIIETTRGMIEGTRSWADNLFAMMLDTNKIQDLRCDLPLGTKWNMWAPSGYDKHNGFR